jgi:positive regulator of sigma E activity
MDCRARVIEKEGDQALVRVARINCAECGGCGLLARNREHTMEFSAVDRLGVNIGDEVLLEVPSRSLVLSYLAVFGLPLLVMAAAYFAVAAVFSLAGGGDGTAAGVVAAVLCGLVSLWVGARLAERRGLNPTIVEVIAPAEESDGGQGYVL